MRFRFSALLIAIVTIVLSSELRAAPPVDTNGGGSATSSFCSAPEIGREEQSIIQKQIDDWVSRHAAALAVGGNVKIAWHVIYDGSTGNIPQSTIDATIVALNDAYAGSAGGVSTGYTFTLASVDRTNKRQWFVMEAGSTAERQAKNALAKDVTHRLNIYSCAPPSHTNWGTFPWSYTEGDKMVGVVLHIGYLPGGSLPPLNTGDIAVHEVGHYLGLYHTFQGGCTPPGDGVDDTPDEAVPPGCCPCPEGADTCPSAGLDPIHNYMDYTSDLCRTEFTAGQDARMDAMVPQYRPHLLNAAFGGDGSPVALDPRGAGDGLTLAGGVDFQGATPNPFRTQTEIRFSLPASRSVELRVYNAGGRLVAELVNGPVDAGAHTVTFDGTRLPSGIYFAALRVDGRLLTRSTVLSR